MNKYLPSKRFSYAILAIILAILIIWGVDALVKKQAKLEQTKNAEKVAAESKRAETLQQFMAIDSDKDTLKDWEEALWKTDPQNPDSDGDGTNDGEEIRSNRDPIKKAPGDEIDPKIIRDNEKAEADFNSLSTTDKFSRVLFSDYLATKKVDSKLTESDTLTIISEALSNLSPLSFKIYKENDISISANNDAQSLRNYSNDLSRVIINNMQTKTETIDTILSDFSASEDINRAKDALSRIGPIVTKNRETVSSLLKISVPSTLSKEHLKILNSFEEIYESVAMIASAQDDIIMMIQPLNHYDLSIKSLAENLMEMRQKVFSLKVTFANKTDFGYQLFNVIMLKN